MMRRTRESASTATCPVCGSKDKPLAQGRFCRHIDSITGECPAAGKTVAEARNLQIAVQQETDSMSQLVSAQGPPIATDIMTSGAPPAPETAPAKRARKPRSDRALYMVLAAATAPVLFHTQDEAGAEATDCAQNDAANGAYIVYQVRPLRRFQLQHGVQETPLGHERRTRA